MAAARLTSNDRLHAVVRFDSAAGLEYHILVRRKDEVRTACGVPLQIEKSRYSLEIGAWAVSSCTECVRRGRELVAAQRSPVCVVGVRLPNPALLPHLHPNPKRAQEIFNQLTEASTRWIEDHTGFDRYCRALLNNLAAPKVIQPVAKAMHGRVVCSEPEAGTAGWTIRITR